MGSESIATSDDGFKPYFRVLLCVLVGFLMFNLLTLSRVPELPHADDGGYAAAAYEFWRTGHPGVPGFRDVVGLNQDCRPMGRIAAAVQGVFMWFCGISLFAAQLPSFLVGMAVLWMTFNLGRVLWDKRTGLLAVSILCASGIFYSACRWTRPDILLALCFVSALYLLASVKRGVISWRHAAAGLIMGFSGDVHLNGFLLAPVPIMFWFFLSNTHENRLRGVITYVCSGMAGVVYWLGLHVLPDPEGFFRQFALYEKTHGLRIANLGVFGALYREMERYITWFWRARLHRNVLEGLLILACGIWIISKGSRTARTLIFAWFAVFLTASAFMANPYGWYLIYVWPLFALWLAHVFFVFFETKYRQWVMVGLVLIFAGYLFNLAAWTAKACASPSYTQIAREIRSLIPKNASVIAGGEWWFALWDRDFTDAAYLSFRALEASINPDSRPTGWDTEWKRLGWDYVVASGDMRDLFDTTVPVQEAVARMGITRMREIIEARAFSSKHATLIKEIQAGQTPVQIYRLSGR